MKIDCVKEILENALGKLNKVAGKNPTLPVLSCILIETKKNQISLKATNLEVAAEILIPAKITEEGKVAIPAQTLTSFISNFSSTKTIHFEIEGENLKVSGSGSRALIKALPNDDFPSFPEVGGSVVFTLPAKDFVKGLESVGYSASGGSLKPELASVSLRADGDFLVFAATDSFRLAEKKIKIKNQPEIGSLLIPIKNTLEISRLLEGVNEDIEINVEKNQIAFYGSGLSVVSRLVDGNFPDYQQIIPKTITTEATVLKNDLANALKLANVFSDKFNQANFTIDPARKLFEVKTKNEEIGENEQKLEGALSGEEVAINFNYRYVTDVFQSINSDSLHLALSGLSKPMVISGVGDKTFLYLVMPMNK